MNIAVRLFLSQFPLCIFGGQSRRHHGRPDDSPQPPQAPHMHRQVVEIAVKQMPLHTLEAIALPGGTARHRPRSPNAGAIQIGLVRIVDDAQIKQQIAPCELLRHVEQAAIPPKHLVLGHQPHEIAMGKRGRTPVQLLPLRLRERRAFRQQPPDGGGESGEEIPLPHGLRLHPAHRLVKRGQEMPLPRKNGFA